MALDSFHINNEPKLKKIIEGCLAQRQEAQRDLFKLYFGYAKSICLRYSSNREEAEEVLNTGFLKIFQNLEKYDPIQPFRAWLRTIMINTAIDYYRKEQKHNQNIPLGDTIDVPFDDNILDKISAEEILELVQQLPKSYRTVFMLYVVDGYNHREIGELLGISEGTSKSNLAVARTKLKNM
ncbi:MAG: RNA polymerase sigma factor, partial [Bacteroidia bacterium]